MIYDFKMKGITGEEISFSDYREKVVLIVNTASKCGFTPQFKGLEELYLKYKDQGLVILGFPCNQFGGQEPGSEVDIQQGCMLNYGVSFPMFAKIDVNGKNEDTFYKKLNYLNKNSDLERINLLNINQKDYSELNSFIERF